jgi:glycosyltransferase involved in cell wall biosynthesis
VDLAAFDPDALPSPDTARIRLGLPTHGPVVTMVARLQRWKGVHVFVAAAAQILRHLPDATFVVVGGDHPTEPDYPAELARQVDAAGARERIRLVGLQADVPLWMQAADVVVHASFDEPAGAVVIEGMALGKPVVAARSAGPMEFVTDDVDGRLATPGDEDELASVIVGLLNDDGARERLGMAARVRAREFGADRFSANIAAAMQSLVAHRAAATAAPSPAGRLGRA